MADNVATLYPKAGTLEAEQALIGACLRDARAFDVCTDLVSFDDFSEDIHGHIWRAFSKARSEGGALDWRLVKAILGDAASMAIGDMNAGQYLARLAADAVSIDQAPDFARIIKDAADVNRLNGVAAGINAASRSILEADPESIVADAYDVIDRIMQSRARTNTPRVSLGAAADRALAQAQASKGKARGLSWGLDSLDRLTLGLRPSHLYIIGGRPGMGKTMLALSVALNVARAGNGVFFASLEMDDVELSERALASETERQGKHITYQQLAANDVPADAVEALQDAYERMRDYPLEIDPQQGVTLGQIRARAKQVRMQMERRGVKLGLVVIDHIGLIGAGERYRGSKYAETTEVSNGLKGMAKELGIPVVALAQLNRQSENREDKRAQLSDLRETGALEQDADCVIFPYREAYHLKKKADLTQDDIQRLVAVEHIMEIAIAKQRNGPEGRFEAFCLPGSNVVRDMEYRR